MFFGFWISHVPDASIPDFMDRVDRALQPGGRVAMLDNKGGPDDENVVESVHGTTDRAAGLSERNLADGRTFTIVKVFRSPERLAELLAPLGWTVTGGSSARFFVWAEAARTR